ncbi:alpha/beta hydrolase [uncultured Stenotrophomonas sp.]|uniref:alpha/beta fold hydrolase n=1 Tax=uncultured Stenotrophomonas sp. TaxID=165438 RepID=UPI0028D5B5E0|nr:alpha/beta hydrolase [uncultured Stenotrophomonas sp.]
MTTFTRITLDADARYPRDAWFGKHPDTLPRTLILQGTLDPNTAYAGAEEHAAVLGKAGPVTFHTVERGAHLLPLVAPACFTAAVNAFVAGGAPAERCAEPGSE